eukprot:sb/3471593/
MNFEANLQRDAQGRMFIPSTQRPDGSWRPVKYVKEGYVPQDEQDTYRSKGKKWSEGATAIPGYTGPTPKSEERMTNADLAASNKPKLSKNQKKRAKKKEAKREDEFVIEEITTGITEQVNISKDDKLTPGEIEKKKKGIMKKLRAIEDLQAKVDAGEIVPDKDQVAKLSKKKELEKQLKEL